MADHRQAGDPCGGRRRTAHRVWRQRCSGRDDWHPPCAHYANRYAAAAGKSIAVFTNNDSGYRTARDLKAHGVHVEVIIDCREDAKADAGNIPVLATAAVVNVSGGKGVTAVELGRSHAPLPAMHSRCPAAGARSSISCAIAAPSPMWNDAHRRPSCRPMWARTLSAAGSAAGHNAAFECLADGAAKGTLKGQACRPSPKMPATRPLRITPLWWVKESTGKAFVDYQNDATAEGPAAGGAGRL